MFDESRMISAKALIAEPHQSLSKFNLRRPETGDAGIVGGYIRRVTPVPIPNTVVKPAEPMILLQRESRSLPAFKLKP